MYNIVKPQIPMYVLASFGIQKLFRLVYFFDKKYKKKKIGLLPLLNYINQTLLSRKKFFFCLVNSYVVEILTCLKELGFVFDFLVVPSMLFQAWLLFGKKVFLNRAVVLVYLLQNSVTLGGVSKIKFFSRPSRQVYMSYLALKKLCRVTIFGQRVFVLTTAFGLLTHTEVLEKKVGGTLLLMV